MTESDKDNIEFRKLFFEYLKLIRNLPYVTDDRETRRIPMLEVKSKVMDMIWSNQVSRITIVATMFEGLKTYPDSYPVIDRLLSSLIGPKAEDGAYPELLWFLLASIQPSDRDTEDKIVSITRSLIRLIGHKLTRSYLNYLVLTGSKEEARLAIPAYYYIAHDIDSMHLVAPFATENDLNLSFQIYAHALRFVFEGEKQLSEEDTDFLIKFFEKGLTYRHSTIAEYCTQALEKLKKA